jgi:hypothetical protein
MAAVRKDLRVGEIRFKLTCEATSPSIGHQACGPNCVKVAHTTQRIFSAAVNNPLRLDRLPGTESFRFQQDRMVTSAANAVEAPQSSGPATEHEDV